MAAAAISQDAIQRLTIVATSSGLSETDDKLRSVARAQDEVAAASTRSERATDNMERRVQSMQRANDNYRRSLEAVNDNIRGSIGTISETAEKTLKLGEHIAGLAAKAYLLSPAFRAFVNPSLINTMKAIGPVASEAAGAAFAAFSPLFALLGRLSIPIYLVVAAWRTMNYVIDLGSGLLERYGNAQRNLVSGVDENLTKLTKFQENNLSAQQIQYATELGGRLNEAKRSLAEFWKIQFDLTDPALKLQNVWVLIVETIAKGLTLLGYLPQKMADAANAVGNSSIWDKLNWGWNLPGKQRLLDNQPAAPSLADDMAAARQRLAAGMGSTSNFANRFGQAINDLANPPEKKDEKEVRNAWTSTLDSVSKSIALMEADAVAVDKSSGAHQRLRIEAQLLEAALRAKLDPASEEVTKEIERLGKRAEEAATNLARLKLQSDLAFERAQLGRDPTEAAVASRLRPIYGADYVNQMNSTDAAEIRSIENLKTIKSLLTETATGALRTFRSELDQTGNAWTALGRTALKTIDNIIMKLADKALENAITGMFANIGKASSSYNFGGINVPVIGGASRGGLFGGLIIPGLLHDGGLGMNAPLSGRYVHPAYFENAPRFHDGKSPIGPGEMAAIIRPKEEVLTTRDPRHSWNSGGQQSAPVTFVYSPNIDARGADAAAVARLAAAQEKDRRDLSKNVLTIVTEARANKPGVFK